MAIATKPAPQRLRAPALLARLAALDIGLPAALLLAVAGAWPLLTRPSLPTLTDAHHHVYRTFEILSAWREGVAYLRWAPDFYFGYGYPVFNYYAPLTYYLAAAYGLVFGPVAGIKFVLVAAALVGGLGLYLLARECWGPAAGVAAAAAYSLSPYLAFVDPVLRGAAPDALALSLGPLLLWLGLRLARAPTRALFVATTGALAALLLAHNLLSLVTVAVLAAWVAWQLPTLSRPVRWRALRAHAAALALALGLTAFFWLPAWLERDAIQLEGAFLPGQARGQVAPAELFGPAVPRDADAVQIGDFRFRLGWPQWVLGALGALRLLHRGPHRRAVWFFALLAAGTLGLILPASALVWAAVPPLAYLQFAWRLLGVAALALAMLAGAATAWGRALPQRQAQPVLSAVIVAACLLAALPLLNPLPWPNFGPVEAEAVMDLELSGRWGVGTTHGIEFMPRAVQWAPVPHPDVVAAYRVGAVEKVDRGALPPTVSVAHTAHGALHDVFETASPASFALRVLTHDFPGWTAYLDGRRLPHRASAPEGWITLDVPAGAHTLRLQLEDTPARRLGWAVAALSALALAGVAAWPRPWPTKSATAAPQHLSPRLALVLGASVAAVLLLHTVSLGLARPPIDNLATLAAFEGNLVLAHFDLPQTRFAPGSAFPLTLYWYALAPAPQPLSVFIHVYGADGALWGQADQLDPLANFPATRWRPFVLRPAAHTVALFPATPPGRYTLAAGLWQRTTGARSALLDAAGAPTPETYYVLTNALEVVAQ